MSDRILVPYDGSEPADYALEFAFETFADADVTALHVIQIPEGYWGAFEGPDISPPVTEKAREYAEELLEPARELAADRDRDLETEILSGKPDDQIVAYAEEEGYDAIVVGSHGREGISRVLLGSVAENVVRRSPTPVVVARDPDVK
ncbi:UspA domain-containing protein [Natronococcus amylolyticus DSM 10524]|uniref:UspA domain-containing protein n=1 Tax=Natronococcus amylolyticus DSM 10524 TaxID=1227497 RepID=L9WY90_9EURY|nr:universal stress protein [Natronococcus amylolyticus]ELY54434.1 UspA domain-containing protein [Natronococcus amylolyticus DSM 10524]